MAVAQTARKILIAIDPSQQAEYAFDWYMKSVHQPSNELVLVHVPEFLEDQRNSLLYLTVASYEEAVRKAELCSKELKEKFETKIAENKIKGRVRIDGGSKPGEVICRVAEEEHPTMIVIGTRGLGAIRRTILGSVSDHVIHHAQCPVIVCRQ